MKTLKNLTFVFLIVLCLSCMSAVPPVTTIIAGDVSLLLEVQLMSSYQFGEARFSIIHILNSTNGFQITNTTNPNIECHLHLRDSQGFEVMDAMATPHLDHWDLNGSLGGMTPIGSYAWTVNCNDYDAEWGGAISGYFDITEDGEIPGETDTVDTNATNLFILITIIFFIILIGLVLGLIFTRGKFSFFIFLSILYIFTSTFLLILWKISSTITSIIPFFEVLFQTLWKVSNIGYFIFFPVLLFFMVMKKFNDTGDDKLRNTGYSDDDIKMVRNRGKRR